MITKCEWCCGSRWSVILTCIVLVWSWVIFYLKIRLSIDVRRRSWVDFRFRVNGMVKSIWESTMALGSGFCMMQSEGAGLSVVWGMELWWRSRYQASDENASHTARGNAQWLFSKKVYIFGRQSRLVFSQFPMRIKRHKIIVTDVLCKSRGGSFRKEVSVPV